MKSTILPILTVLALAGGCAAMAGGGAGPNPASLPMALDRLRPETAEVGALRFRGALELPGGAGVGGLSGLWVSSDGSRFLALSDNARMVTGRLSYDDAGHLSEAGDFTARNLRLDDATGQGGRWNDSEEVARLPKGGWLVSFERNHRILRYPSGAERPDGVPERLPAPPGLEDAPPNGGIEAMAALSDGRLFVIEEGDHNGAAERRAWIAKPGLKSRNDWQPVTYRAAPRFRPTGAAALPDGGALVLERRVSLLGGWSSRIVHVPADALRPGATIDGAELARLEPPLLVDNFEGIAVRTGAGGETLIYLVSDDNRSPLQRTYLMMFALPAAEQQAALPRR